MSHDNSAKHPYMNILFWMTPANQFWKRGDYTPRGKAYFAAKEVEWAKELMRKNKENLIDVGLTES